MRSQLGSEGTSVKTIRATKHKTKYLTFFLGEEEYAFDILKVVEIIGMIKPTPIPKTPKYICGIVNLRGKVLPVMDLRTKFNMSAKKYDDETVIIDIKTRQLEIGFVVDRVSEVVDIKDDEITERPDFGVQINHDFITGIGKIDERIIILLDIDKVLCSISLDGLDDALENKNVREITVQEEMVF